MKIATKLDGIGVDVIQGGMALRDKDALKALSRLGLNAKIECLITGWTPDWKEALDAAADSGVYSVGIAFRSSDLMLKNTLKMTREQMVDGSVKNVEYAKARGLKVCFAPTDATRTDINFLKKVCLAAVKAGADRIGLPDTVGVAKPSAIKYLFKEIGKTVKVPLESHCHNDYGLALAGELAALEAGAQFADVCINGLGDRTGNVSLDEFVVAVKVLYGIDLKIKYEKLYELSEMVEKLSNIGIPWNKPIVGPNAFVLKADVHVKAASDAPFLFESFPPEMVGNKRRIALGKGTGPMAVKVKATQLNITIPEKDIPLIVKNVNEEAIKKKNELTDEDFKTIVKRAKGPE